MDSGGPSWTVRCYPSGRRFESGARCMHRASPACSFAIAVLTPTMAGLRHSHKTWLIADGIPEIAQARRLGHHLSNRLVEVYSHVAPEIENRLLQKLERRWKHATRNPRPVDNRPRRTTSRRDPHTAAAQRTTAHRTGHSRTPQLTATSSREPMRRGAIRGAPDSLQIGAHRDQLRPWLTIIA